MLSVNTNTGAMVALQYLNQTNSQLTTVQNAINSGLKVASAKDDGATFAIAQNMRGDVAAYGAVTDSLNRGSSSVDVALSAGQSISDLLIEMKTKALAASDASLDTASRQAMNEDFTALRDQIASVVQNAVFNGVNLVDGSTTQITALASADGSKKITVSAQNMSLGRFGRHGCFQRFDLDPGQGRGDDHHRRSLVDQRELLSRPAFLGREEVLDPVDLRDEPVEHPADGIGNLVDADMATESAKLQSLQVKQQLGVQALSIANQAPSITLSLFH